MPTIVDLHYFQSLPLDIKVSMTITRIREWVNYFGVSGVYVSFSGGKDSTVLLHIARSIYPDIPACFVDTGLEFPEIKSFVKSFDNVDIIRPKKTFKQVICDYGYPFISKEIARKLFYYRNGSRWALKYSDPNFKPQYQFYKYIPITKCDFILSSSCCDVMKKNPVHLYSRNTGRMALTAQMAIESSLRRQKWLQFGCNVFDLKNPISNPMSFWTDQDVLQYIKENNLPISSVYGDIVYEDFDGQCRLNGCGYLCTSGCKRTGCVFCGFGAHLEKGSGRFVLLKRSHPKLYQYCMGGGSYDINGIWKPDNNGLGMYHVISELNNIFGSDFIKL